MSKHWSRSCSVTSHFTYFAMMAMLHSNLLRTKTLLVKFQILLSQEDYFGTHLSRSHEFDRVVAKSHHVCFEFWIHNHVNQKQTFGG